MKLQKPKGTQDILPQESAKWQYVEEFARETFRKYNYAEIRTPIFEHYEVISRSVGDTTDIVTKEMYDFYDKGDRHITLRPEGTAPVVRSYVENKLFAPEVQKPVKLYYMGSMFRYERPQAGRLREFHQIGAECFGSSNPATDVEMIAMAAQFFKEIGITNVSLELNTLGNPESRAASSESNTLAGPTWRRTLTPETLATAPSGARLPCKMINGPSARFGFSSGMMTF